MDGSDIVVGSTREGESSLVRRGWSVERGAWSVERWGGRQVER